MGSKISKDLWTLIDVLELAVDAKDHYTHCHQHSVAHLCQSLGQALKLTADEIECLFVCGKLHDVGKINIPSEIIQKPGKLTKREYEIVKDHALGGQAILANINFPWPVAKICSQHHERINGSGYPYGLNEKEILFEAKIVAIADVMHSIMLPRPYRKALGMDFALDELEKNSGILYDKNIAEECIKIFRERPQSISEEFFRNAF